MACKSLAETKEVVKRVLSEADKPLTFNEILERVLQVCGGDVNKFVLREALASLVREGLVERVRGDETRGLPKMVFRLRVKSASR